MNEGNIENLVREINALGKNRLHEPELYGVIVNHDFRGRCSRQSILFGVTATENARYLELCAFSLNFYLDISKRMDGILSENGYVMPPTASMKPVGGEVFFPKQNGRGYCILEDTKQIISAQTSENYPYFKINDYNKYRTATKASMHIQKSLAKSLSKSSNPDKELIKCELDLGYVWADYLREDILKIGDCSGQFEKIENIAELPERYRNYKLIDLFLDEYKLMI